mgnify:CR=1 FL=1
MRRKKQFKPNHMAPIAREEITESNDTILANVDNFLQRLEDYLALEDSALFYQLKPRLTKIQSRIRQREKYWEHNHLQRWKPFELSPHELF